MNQEIKTIICKKGIIIPIAFIDQNVKTNIIKQLTIKITTDKVFHQKPKYIKLWTLVDDKFLIVPKFFKYQKYNFNHVKNLLDSNIKKIDIEFLASLNNQQLQVINNTEKKLINDLNILYCLPCGFGKTVLSIYWICKLKIKTFILVHKEDLLNQWIERIKQFTNIKEEEITIINSKNKKINDNVSIIIGMIQTIMTDNFDDSIIPQDIGLLICDECHHLGAQQFNQSIRKIPTKYYISLSATPYRKDGSEIVYKSFLGYNEYMQERLFNDPVVVFKCKYDFSDEFKNCNEKFINNVKQFSNLTTLITEHKERNDKILILLNELINQNKKILILSNRISQLDYLFSNIQKNHNLVIHRSYGKNREDVNNCDILFATYAMASEGLDVKNLNTLILASPITNIIQCCGRIMRENNGTQRQIYDIIDDILENFYYVRKKHYLKFVDQIQNYDF